MDSKKVVLTPGGKQKLEAELEHLKVNRRREVAEEIREAKLQGDLSENYEYTVAKEAQADLEARIVEIEQILLHAEIVEESMLDKKVVSVGCKVTVVDEQKGNEETFHIVGTAEANPLENKISNESPLGMALLDRKKGETVELNALAGKIRYKITKIKV